MKIDINVNELDFICCALDSYIVEIKDVEERYKNYKFKENNELELLDNLRNRLYDLLHEEMNKGV